MKLNKFSILTLIFSILCLILVPFYFFNKLNFDFIALFLGLTQIFSGLSDIKNSKNLGENNSINGTKIIGILILIIGILLIIAASIKILF